MIAGEGLAARLVEAAARLERLSAAALIRTSHEDVVDTPVRFPQGGSIVVGARKRGGGSHSGDAEGIGEIDATAADGGETTKETDLVGVGLRVEVAAENRRKSGDGRDIGDAVGHD